MPPSTALALNRLIEHIEKSVDESKRLEMISSSHTKILAAQFGIAEVTMRRHLTALVRSGILAKGNKVERGSNGTRINYVVYVLKLPGTRFEYATNSGLCQIAKTE